MSERNIHGLTRTVPQPIQRAIRQRCGFGCVICGLGFYDYEHFDPDFKDAKIHDAAGMTLLCSQCNQKRARNRLSAETVAAANAHPKCLQQGFASELFDFWAKPIEIKFAGVSFCDVRHLIVVNGRPILSVEPPEAEGEPVRFSAVFTDGSGRICSTVEDNVWRTARDMWDVEWKGPRLTVRTAKGSICLVLRLDPPKALVIEKIDMLVEGAHFRGDSDNLHISVNGSGFNTFTACSVESSWCGIAIETQISPANDFFF